MQQIEWTDELSVGIKELDEQHKKLVDIINTFDDVVSGRIEEGVLVNTLEKLLDYTKIHFADEEELMILHNYPGYDHHKEEHISLHKEVLSLYMNYNHDDQETATKLASLLSHWFSDHIIKDDKKSGKYLNSKGVI